MTKQMSFKVIKCGDVYEIIQYGCPVNYGFCRDEVKLVREKASDEVIGKRSDNLLRARQAVRHYIWANAGKYPKFLTLTYAENMQDYEQFKRDWYTFTQAMKRKGFTLRYLYVLEYQQRGAIHAHVVIFNDEYIPQDVIEAAWRRGFVKINKIDHVRNLGAYVCKYLNKADIQYYGSYAYHVSRGLKKPEILRLCETDFTSLKDILAGLEITYQDTIFDDVTQSYITYKQGKKKGGSEGQ